MICLAGQLNPRVGPSSDVVTECVPASGVNAAVSSSREISQRRKWYSSSLPPSLSSFLLVYLPALFLDIEDPELPCVSSPLDSCL